MLAAAGRAVATAPMLAAAYSLASNDVSQVTGGAPTGRAGGAWVEGGEATCNGADWEMG